MGLHSFLELSLAVLGVDMDLWINVVTSETSSDLNLASLHRTC